MLLADSDSPLKNGPEKVYQMELFRELNDPRSCESHNLPCRFPNSGYDRILSERVSVRGVY